MGGLAGGSAGWRALINDGLVGMRSDNGRASMQAEGGAGGRACGLTDWRVTFVGRYRRT